MSLQHLYVVTGCWRRDSTSSPVPPKRDVSLHNTLFLCILHNVWLGFLIFIFYIEDTTTSITLFSSFPHSLCNFPLSLQKYSSFAHVSEKRTAYLTMELRGNTSGKISAYFSFHLWTSWLLPLRLPIESGLSFAPVCSVIFTVLSICYFWTKSSISV